MVQPAEVAEGVRSAFGSLVRAGLLFDGFRKAYPPTAALNHRFVTELPIQSRRYQPAEENVALASPVFISHSSLPIAEHLKVLTEDDDQ